jgi:hypothetical protein
MQEFPHALSRSLTKASPKKQVVIQRVGSSRIGDISKLTLKDIFYKIDYNQIEEEGDQLRIRSKV